MRNRSCVLLGVGFGLICFLHATSASAISPSFNCSAASTPDEIAICNSDELSELDNIVADGFNFVRLRYGTTKARKIGRPLLARRKTCGSDQNCIFAAQIEAIQAYQKLGAPIRLPQWVTNPPSSPPTQTPPTTSEQPAPKEQYVSTGTGFMVSTDGFVLTNRHVVDKFGTVTIHDRGQATIKEVDETNDLALLKMQGSTSAATFRNTSPGLGDAIFALGFPYSGVLGAGINFTGGLISSLSGIGNDSRYLQFTAAVQPGNSGGPLVDGNGLIVGVVSARLADIEMLKQSGSLPQNVNFAIRGDLAMGFLRANGVQPLVAEPKSPLSASEIATNAQTYTVQVTCQPGN